MNTLLRAWLLPVLVMASLATGIAPAYATQTATAQQQQLADYLQLQGVVEATNAATVSAQISGRIERVLVEVGDRVPAGATIVTITSVDQYQALSQAESQLAAANASLLAAQQEYQRVAQLVAQGLLPIAEQDRVKANLDNAQAQQNNAEAAVARAQEQLSYTEVKAPYGGIVSERLVEPGELVQPGTPLMSGFDPAQLRIHIDIPATYASAAGEFKWARVAGVEPTQMLVFPTAHQQSGTQRIRLSLPEATGFLPGQWQRVQIKVAEHQGIVVPAAALYRQGEMNLVKLADGSWRAVRVGGQYGELVEIVAGLTAGEAVQYGN
ncbi:efflux RND transporter periplasmic adaptor subunit [Pseudidiomarina halophila]|uniref:Efflux RND transporter periplasmic adaptor subunit n=1 Tax=Pseudidiomarina halophila TaxID=1449799 RepID=A0A432XT60_9GAMM|nr:efflux RND transporter periplasmic adaptor subunit [Pseudidiomarina halophila]RUO51916.1 efflux RND transporter periplasmic adaptor subunit [Pseudidiomarina halophila]